MLDINDDFNKIRQNSSDLFLLLGVISSNQDLSFIFKKTEKISQGLFLATNHIKDNETIKWIIREKAVDIVCSSAQLGNTRINNIDYSTNNFLSTLLDITTLLNIASVSSLISYRNSSILISEINTLLKYINESKDMSLRQIKNAVLSPDFFKVEDVFKTSSGSHYRNDQHISNATYSSVKDSTLSNKKQYNKPETQTNLRDKKNTRQEQILSLLKTQSDLTIKDFSRVIKDCSPKTIQRELIDLTRGGFIVKQGERRWSKYSIKN